MQKIIRLSKYSIEISKYRNLPFIRFLDSILLRSGKTLASNVHPLSSIPSPHVLMSHITVVAPPVCCVFCSLTVASIGGGEPGAKHQGGDREKCGGGREALPRCVFAQKSSMNDASLWLCRLCCAGGVGWVRRAGTKRGKRMVRFLVILDQGICLRFV